MIINHNMNALNAHRNMMSNITQSGKSMEKLSSGLRINRAGDDAAGLAISEKMRGQIRGLDQAQRNAQDGISMIQTAEGALNETHSILQRMRELSTQAANDTNTGEDRGQIQNEINQLTSEINRIGNTTEFNTQKLLNAKDATTVGKASSKAFTDLTITAKEQGKVGDDIKITFVETGATDDVEVSVSAKTITIKGKAADKLTNKAIKEAIEKNADANKLVSVSVAAGKDAEKQTAKADQALAGGVDAPKFEATLQIGANKGQAFNMTIGDMRSRALGISGKTGDAAQEGAAFTATEGVTDGTTSTKEEMALDVSSHDNATNAIKVLDNAINTVSTERSKLGAYQNRLEHTINNLGTSSENLTAAESRIRDVDMAKEMMTFSKDNILQQAAQAMLAQAKQAPQGVLQLLR